MKTKIGALVIVSVVETRSGDMTYIGSEDMYRSSVSVMKAPAILSSIRLASTAAVTAASRNMKRYIRYPLGKQRSASRSITYKKQGIGWSGS